MRWYGINFLTVAGFRFMLMNTNLDHFQEVDLGEIHPPPTIPLLFLLRNKSADKVRDSGAAGTKAAAKLD